MRSKQQSTLVDKLKAQQIDEKVCDFIEDLKDDFDLSTIVYKLASYIGDQEKVKGKDKIGKSKKDIEYLLSRVREGGGGNRNRSQRRRNGIGGGGYTNNRDRNGSNRSRSAGSSRRRDR